MPTTVDERAGGSGSGTRRLPNDRKYTGIPGRLAAAQSASMGGNLVLVRLSDEQLAAVEGWRAAHGNVSQAEAIGELVRLGLLGEIARIYRFVTDSRAAGSGKMRPTGKAPKTTGPSQT